MSRTTAVLFLVLILASAAFGQEGAAEKAGPGPALVLIDIQAFYFPEGAVPLTEPEIAAANAGRLLARWREAGRPVVHVGHQVKQGGDFHPDVAPVADEKIVMKSEVSAFNGTDLTGYLRELGVERLVIVGMQTHMCLEGAVRAAYDLGFECTVVADACATRDLTYGDDTVAAGDVHAATLSTLDRVYARVIDTAAALEEF